MGRQFWLSQLGAIVRCREHDRRIGLVSDNCDWHRVPSLTQYLFSGPVEWHGILFLDLGNDYNDQDNIASNRPVVRHPVFRRVRCQCSYGISQS